MYFLRLINRIPTKLQLPKGKGRGLEKVVNHCYIRGGHIYCLIISSHTNEFVNTHGGGGCLNAVR